MNIFDINQKIKQLLINKKFYVKHNRFLKIKYEENYHGKVRDPDGNKRNLEKEQKFKLLQLKYILTFLKNKKPCKILDIGCGHGWLLSAINKRWNKHGIDISLYTATSASKFCKVFTGEIQNYTEKNFDIITALHVIEHHPKPEIFLDMIKKRLKKGGILILETPNFDSAAARRFGNRFRLLHDKTHVSLFSEDSLLRMVRSKGFDVFDINYPFFETPFFTKKNINRILHNKGMSPPFYGSIVTLFLIKK